MKSSLRMSVSGRGLLCLVVMWFLVGFSFQPVQGNNIRINAPVKVSAGTGDTLVLEFPLEWSSSWRDEFNWDAAWVFLKYKVGSGDWKPVSLSFGGHSISGSSGQPVHFDYMPGQTGSNTLGVFVYRSKSESGPTSEIICKLKCLKSDLGGMTPEKFDNHEAFIRAQAIEMAYVPYGAYYLGDDASNKSFTKTEKIFYGPIPESSDIVNNTSGYAITASHAVAGCPATNAADHQNNSIHGTTSSWYASTTSPCWWKIDFKAGKTLRFFGVSGASNYPSYAPNGTWYLEGSNDDVNWTKLSTMAASAWRAPSVSYPVQQSIVVKNPGSYRYYRLSFPYSNYTIVQNIAMTEDLLYPLDNIVGDLVDSETARALNLNTGGSAISIPDAFPKGYKGFYMMKYELSQEQYVAFLNSLTYAQQQERVPGLASMKEGDYIFGDRSQPSNRNGICIVVAPFNGLPVIFANNLMNDGKYAQDNDGQTIACNYLSPNDMLSYCSWSGLRPMSELEYEKACRPIYPELALSKGYVWNTTSVPGRLTAVSKGGQKDEESGSSGANVNAGNTFGPVRCGLFATTIPASNQQTAGATFWGAMEMSGNLRELCYNVNAASTFNGAVLGDGSYSLTAWNNTVANFGVRGGGFSSPDSILRVSDRTEATGYFTSLEQHDSTVTFRGVHPIAVTVTAGTIAVVSICPDKIEIKSVTDASSKFDLTYIWYILKPGSSVWEMIPGETGTAIPNYVVTESFGTDASRVYKFKRKAVALVGEATTAEVSLTVPNMKLSLNAAEVFLNSCNISDKTIIATVASGNCQWYYKNNLLSVSGNSYVADRSHFGDESKAGGDFTVICRYSNSGCQAEQRLVVHVAPGSLDCPSTVQDIEGNIYPTIKIDCQCWMNKNLNVGTYHASTDDANGNHWQFDNNRGIEKWCYGNQESNCDTYGGLYEWWQVMCGGACSGQVSAANAMNLNLPGDMAALSAYGVKFNRAGEIQGICPAGWHLPKPADWQFVRNLYGYNFPPGWNQQLGARWNGGGFDYYLGSYWFSWMSASYGSGEAYYIYVRSNAYITNALATIPRSNGMAVRCLKD